MGCKNSALKIKSSTFLRFSSISKDKQRIAKIQIIQRKAKGALWNKIESVRLYSLKIRLNKKILEVLS